MKTASVISVLGHGAVMLWALVSFTGDKFEVTPAESLPVDLVTPEQFSQLTKGAKTAPKEETPKPLVEKIEEPKPVEDPAPKIKEKKQEVAANQTPVPPADQIEEKLSKPEQKQQQAENEPPPLPQRKPPPRKQPKFDADKIAALLDKRDPTRDAAAGDVLSPVPSLGAASGTAARLSQSELDALRARLMALWNPPVGIKNPEELVIRVRMRLGRDGKLSAPPQVITSGRGTLFNTARDSAIRAIYRGQPFDMLKPENYETWKDVEITFDPRDMFRG